MFQGEQVLALIPARGGSKGLPGKNLRALAGRPMLAHSVIAARDSRFVDRVVVSSDDDAIVAAGRAAGAEVPFVRPAHLADDVAPMVDVALHAVDSLTPRPGWLLLLQPTSPLRRAEDIDAGFALLERTHASSCVSVTTPNKHPSWMYTLGDGGRLSPLLKMDGSTRRQDLPPVLVLNGAVYIIRVTELERTKRFVDDATVGFEMPAERSIDIDSRLDFALAELLLAPNHD